MKLFIFLYTALAIFLNRQHRHMTLNAMIRANIRIDQTPVQDPRNVTVSQVHLAIAGNDSDCIRVHYKGTELHPFRLKYALQGNDTWTTVPSDENCQYFPDDPDYYQSAVTEKLLPNKRYNYQIVDHWDSVQYTGTFRGPKTVNDTLILSVFADWGWGEHAFAEETYQTLMRIKDGVDGFIHAGDISYSDDGFNRPGHMFDFTYEFIYNSFMSDLAPIADSKPYMVCPGNHESECHSPSCIVVAHQREHLSNFTAYNCRFHMPSKESGGVLSMWYSYNWGPVHFVSMNTETNFHNAGEENQGDSQLFPAGHFGKYEGRYLEWLEEDLKKANATRNIRPWLIAYGHRPLYEKGHDCVEPAVCEAFEELLKKYEVDLYIAGHIHTYQRYTPLDNSRPVHVYPGGAGCDERVPDEFFEWKGKDHRHDYYGYGWNTSTGILEVNRTHASWYMINSVTNKTFDPFVLRVREY